MDHQSHTARLGRPDLPHKPTLFLLGPGQKGGCSSKIIYHLPIQGQPLLVLLSCLRVMSQRSVPAALWECIKMSSLAEGGTVLQKIRFFDSLDHPFKHIVNTYHAQGTIPGA